MLSRRLVGRRHALWLSLASLSSIGAIALTKTRYDSHKLQALANLKRDFKVSGIATLRKRAATKGLIFGAASSQDILSKDTAFATQFAQECSILVPEGELKWNFLRPTPKKFDFTQSDWLAEFAKNHNMLFRGHTLVWHDALPAWFKTTVNSGNAEKFLTEHISTVTKHYAGRIHSWDVVNEAVEPKDGRSDGLKNTPWMQFLGPNYIELAFRVAAQADPQALLVYNDYGLEYDTPEGGAKRVAVLKLLKSLKSRGTPIHGLGIQSHLSSDDTPFNPHKLRKFLADVASLGLKILITELDVTDVRLPENSGVRDRIVAGVYEDYLSVVLDEPAVIGVLTWGLSDRYTWNSTYNPRSDSKPVRPLPLDSNLQRKLAWNAMARAFDKARKR
ncbi:endo-1,4-beta-xylanase [Calothrix sp. PCC 7507]|uniref:endo-1,4-beta-xylanase n=1 Tax=Calothrix sp. PCC 7507 TaxID=99598 RepID=UPI00029F41D3|nr:endo-1,4-beta-xylanase [Calothrix sp. PCC 7507]AFY32527.1 Endo-1,4-beta-xylanase [Calothrix sp. PCC 7507]